MELSELKRSREILLSVLKVPKTGKHLSCPFHDSKDSFSVWRHEDGQWKFKCHFPGCDAHNVGTVLDAAMLVYRVNTLQEAFRGLEVELGIKIGKDVDLIEPQIDHDRAEGFVSDAHENLMNSAELQKKYMNDKRGIFNLDVIVRYRIGFVTPDKFSMKGKAWSLFGWVLPVTNAAGVLVAVKLHTEKNLWPGLKVPKCVWAPFGTYPAAEPKHGTATLWPPPEDFSGAEKLYVCPGELKALAMIGAGMAATSPTGGESTMKPELVRRIISAKPQKTFITFDDDAPKMINGKFVSAGNVWKDGMINALKGAGMLCYAFSFGKSIETPLQETADAVQKTIARAPEARPAPIEPRREEVQPALTTGIAGGWSAEERELIAWYRSMPLFHLPKVPFELFEGLTIPNQSFYDNLHRTISQHRDDLLGDIADVKMKHIRRLQELCACPF